MRLMIPDCKTHRIYKFNKIHSRLHFPHSTLSLFADDFLPISSLSGSNFKWCPTSSLKEAQVWFGWVLEVASKTILMYFKGRSFHRETFHVSTIAKFMGLISANNYFQKTFRFLDMA